MAPKKKAVKKKKPTIPLPPFDYEAPFIAGAAVEYVRCRICNVSLGHLNFEWPAVPTDVTLSTVKEAIVKRHGGTVLDLKLWRDSVHPAMSLQDVDDGTSLKDLGVRGLMAGMPEQLPVVTLHYDFRAARHDDPIATIESQAIRSSLNLDLKSYLQLQRVQT